MSPAPTPLSGCPLRRLEIRDGSTCTVYDAIQLESSLTATLEARRAMTGDHNKSDLMLQSHLGLSRVLSIQLTDLMSSSNNATEIVTVDRPSQKMCIRIQQKKQTILFTFKESRDFNIAMYTLKKFGFRVKDGVIPTEDTTIVGLARSQSCTVPASNDLGPRLSSITPLQRHGSFQAPSPFSFTALLNSDVPLSQMQSMDTQYGYDQPVSPDLSQQPVHHIAPATYAPHQNPYQLYLSQHSNMYQPRVSSPLRNAVDVDSRDLSPLSPNSPMPQAQPSLFANSTVAESYLTHRSISAPNTTPQSWQQPSYPSPDGCGSPHFQRSPPGGSQETTSTCTESDSQSTDGTDVSLPLQSVEDFRKLMPQTRSLPFLKESKATARLEPGKKGASTEHGPPCAKRTSSSFTEHVNRTTSNDKSYSCVQENVSSASSAMDNASAALTASSPTATQATIPQIEAISSKQSPLEICDLPPMLITDNSLLERINQSTSRLLDQYIADVDRGCDGGACAQFYLDQIDMVRRDFWLSQLHQGSFI